MYAKLASRIQIGWPHLHTADDLSHSTVNDRDAQDCINIFPPTLIGSSEALLLHLCARLYSSLCGDFNTCLQHVLPLQTLLKKCFRILHPNNPSFACIEARYRDLLLVYQLYVLERSVHWTGMSSSAFVLLKLSNGSAQGMSFWKNFLRQKYSDLFLVA